MEKLAEFISTAEFFTSIVIIAAALLLWAGIRKLQQKYVSSGKAKGEKATFVRVLFGVLRAVIVLGAMLFILQVNGVNVSSILAGLGLLSAIVGFSLQDVLKDLFMGIHIINDHFFLVGDVVRYGDIEGEVIGFTMNTTKLRNIVDNTVTTICNRNISEITRLPKSSMVDIDLPLSYEEDTKKVHKVLSEICEKIGNAEGIERCEYKGTQAFADSAVIYKLRFFCPPENKPQLNRDAHRIVQDGLEAAGIKIPYNQLDVHTFRK